VGKRSGTVEGELLSRAALALFDEAYYGPSDPRGTWFTDNEPKAGLLGVLEGVSASEASRPLSAADLLTIASHVGHVRYSLSLINRAAKGENPYQSADWAGSWEARTVSEAEWVELLAGLRAEYEAFRAVLSSGRAWKDEELLTGTFAQIAHGAWHLGAIRQALGMVSAPRDAGP